MGVELVLVLKFPIVVWFSASFPGKYGEKVWRALHSVCKNLPVFTD